MGQHHVAPTVVRKSKCDRQKARPITFPMFPFGSFPDGHVKYFPRMCGVARQNTPKVKKYTYLRQTLSYLLFYLRSFYLNFALSCHQCNLSNLLEAELLLESVEV